eukprot:CAMPEP_0117534150 /NCGR_PEP_ID=MMETSP0784-20121206/40260_1 /TAXON_ID=39447 /ORGANISM="" /LENGTH=37 /DNA_ID= /DNA_START= /DNA_END= /DNA_ORIENTATION=
MGSMAPLRAWECHIRNAAAHSGNDVMAVSDSQLAHKV